MSKTESQKALKREYDRQYYHAHKERIQQRSKEYHEAHREELLRKRREFYEAHKDELHEKQKEYRDAHRGEINERARKKTSSSGYGALTLTDEDRVGIHELSYEADYITQQMKLVEDPTKVKFEQYVRTHDMNVQENIDEAFRIVRNTIPFTTARGQALERTVKRLLLNILDGSTFKLYSQVPCDFSGIDRRNCRKIDFVVTEQNCLKDKIDLSKAVVVSCKTRLSTSWREDEAIFDKCKYYIMVSLDDKIPQCQLPDNVRFCTPSSDTSEHTIDMNALTQTIQAMLSDEF